MQYTHQATPDPVAQPEPTVPAGTEAAVQITDNGMMSGRAVIQMDPERKAEADAAKAPDARPAWLPEKFKTAEEMAKSYGELEKAFHAKGKAPEAPAAPEKPATPGTEAPAAEKATLASIGAEFEANGSISEETYQKLEAAGHDRATVDTFIAGQKALATQLRSQIAAVVGGEEQLNKVMEFAKGNPQAAEAYTAAAKTGNVELVKLALAGLNAAYQAAHPSEPKLVTGSPAPSHGDVIPFRSNAEVVEAMSDPRYAKDPAYREQIMRRIAVS